MARILSMKDAINEAIDQEMARDPTVIMMGEDIVGGAGAAGEDDAWGGVLGVSKGLYHKHPKQMIDTPLSESAYVGAAIGAAACGLRPVAELMFIDFMGVEKSSCASLPHLVRSLPTISPLKVRSTPETMSLPAA